MAAPKGRIGGTIEVQANGQILNAVGSFDFNLGLPKREYKVGPDRPHGYTEMPQIGWIEGSIRDGQDIKLTDIGNLVDATVTIVLANGKTIMCSEAVYCADGKGETEEGTFEFKVEGLCEEVGV